MSATQLGGSSAIGTILLTVSSHNNNPGPALEVALAQLLGKRPGRLTWIDDQANGVPATPEDRRLCLVDVVYLVD
jgi:hypothetical protein